MQREDRVAAQQNLAIAHGKIEAAVLLDDVHTHQLAKLGDQLVALIQQIVGCVLRRRGVRRGDLRIQVADAFRETVDLSHDGRDLGIDVVALAVQEGIGVVDLAYQARSEEHTSELQSLMRISYAVFCLKKKKTAHKAYS